MTRSIRGRLLLGVSLATASVLACAGVGVYGSMRASLFRQFDAALADKARAMAVHVEQDGDKIEVEHEALNLPEFTPGARCEYMQLWLDDGPVLARSASLDARDLERLEPVGAEPRVWSMPLPDGRPGRMTALTFDARIEDDHHKTARRPPDGRRVTMVLARETAPIDRTLTQLAWLLGGVGGLATLAGVGLMTWIVGRGLRPLDRLAAEIRALDAANLSSRFDDADAPMEILPVIRTLNGSLSRLEAAFARERAFSSDVAHELRTPLAGLQTTLEVGLTRPRPPSEYREAMQQCLTITRRMRRMIENLLEMARADAGDLRAECGPVDLPPVVRECWASHAVRAAARGLALSMELPDSAVVHGDAARLRQVLDNVFDNAVTYADAGGSVEIEARNVDGGVELQVSNTGSRIAPRQAEQVFERFWRGDAARGDDGAHCGLGLPLCRKLMERLGGGISVQVSAEGRFTLTLRFAPDKAAADAVAGMARAALR